MGRNTNYYGIRFDRRSQNFGFHMIAQSQLIANDRRQSQKIEHGSIFCDRLRSSAITIARSQTIAEVCFHMIADDRRTFCDLRFAIVCDHMETSLYCYITTDFHYAKRDSHLPAYGGVMLQTVGIEKNVNRHFSLNF